MPQECKDRGRARLITHRPARQPQTPRIIPGETQRVAAGTECRRHSNRQPVDTVSYGTTLAYRIRYVRRFRTDRSVHVTAAGDRSHWYQKAQSLCPAVSAAFYHVYVASTVSDTLICVGLQLIVTAAKTLATAVITPLKVI